MNNGYLNKYFTIIKLAGDEYFVYELKTKEIKDQGFKQIITGESNIIFVEPEIKVFKIILTLLSDDKKTKIKTDCIHSFNRIKCISSGTSPDEFPPNQNKKIRNIKSDYECGLCNLKIQALSVIKLKNPKDKDYDYS